MKREPTLTIFVRYPTLAFYSDIGENFFCLMNFQTRHDFNIQVFSDIGRTQYQNSPIFGNTKNVLKYIHVCVYVHPSCLPFVFTIHVHVHVHRSLFKLIFLFMFPVPVHVHVARKCMDMDMDADLEWTWT